MLPHEASQRILDEVRMAMADKVTTGDYCIPLDMDNALAINKKSFKNQFGPMSSIVKISNDAAIFTDARTFVKTLICKLSMCRIITLHEFLLLIYKLHR